MLESRHSKPQNRSIGMDGDRWRQVDKIFHDLIEQTPEQRASFLDRLQEPVQGQRSYSGSDG
jgi:hypothetical protein